MACVAAFFPLTFVLPTRENGCVAQLDRASDYESEGLRFDSLHDHKKGPHIAVRAFFIYSMSGNVFSDRAE